MWLTHPPFPTPNPSIPWGTLSPLFLYPASSHVPISSIRHRLAPSHLHPIWRPKTCLLCRGDFFQIPQKTYWNLDTAGPTWSLSFWPSSWVRPANPTLPAFAKVTIFFANIWWVLAAVAFCIKIPILLFSHMWEEFAILATIKPADQQVLQSWYGCWMLVGAVDMVHMVHMFADGCRQQDNFCSGWLSLLCCTTPRLSGA